MNKYILAIDQGTTSSRAIIYNSNFQIVSKSQRDILQIYPQEGWVEHNPIEIWESQLACCKDAIDKAGILPQQIQAIGITNQRETIVAWDKETGEPICNALVWQDRRTVTACLEDQDSLG
ncbi:MAG: FGGY family carbohydrate kinase, partial [bacterium]